MPREFVESTAIDWIEYHARRRILDVALTTDRLYRYSDVPQPIYEAFMAAESKGRFYNDRIRDEFPFTRLR